MQEVHVPEEHLHLPLFVQSHEQTEDEEDRLRSGLDTKGEDDHLVVSLS